MVCGLAPRWAAEGSSLVIQGRALGDGVGERGRDRQVPVSVRRDDVPEMGGQHRDALIDVAALAVRVDEGADREGMPEIMQSRGPAAWPGFQSASGGQRPEDRDGHVAVEAPTRLADEQGGGAACGVLSPEPQVARESGGCRRVQRDQPLPAVLAGDRQHLRRGVEVADVQGECLAAADAGAGQQPDERPHAGRQHRRRESAGRGHETGGFLTGIQVRDPPGDPAGDEPAGDRVGGGRVQRVDVAGERPHGREPLGVPGPGRPGRGGRERERGGHRDPGLAAGFQAVQERSEQMLASLEPVAAGTALGQVTRGRRAQVRAHRGSPSGQGRAIDRSAVMSDLA